MTEQKAQQAAQALGGETWHSGGGIWLVVLHGRDGQFIIMGDTGMEVYASEDAYGEGEFDFSIEWEAL